jgi:signal transduction histidine kinase
MDDDAIAFPDAPRGELDRAITDLVGRAHDVLQTQGRLRALVKANQAVVSHLELPVVLRTIVEAAVELVGARYGALGVVAPNGTLEQFIHVGMPPDLVEDIGNLPEGHGLLGALIDDPRPIRLDRISDDPRSSGFPAHHPAMDSFLGVPIRVRDLVYGNLYLTNRNDGAFSREDEELVGTFAATAGFAIDNARLFAETEARRAWSAAATEVSSAQLAGESDDALMMLVQSVERLSVAAFVGVLTPDDGGKTVRIQIARGEGAAELEGHVRTLSGGLLAGAIESEIPQFADALDGQTLSDNDGKTWGPVLVVPLELEQKRNGLLVVLRPVGAVAFVPFDLERVALMAGSFGVIMELAAARADRHRMSMLEDRARIARDLHDHVIQQLFATGLELQSIQSALGPGRIADRINANVSTIDAAIAQIRTVIFALSRQAGSVTVRHRILDLADEVAPALAHPAAIAFSGPVDLIVNNGLADDVVAVVREGLTNIGRHAKAEHTMVKLDVANSLITLTIRDDGVGLGGSTRRSGLKNGADRAAQRGGAFSIDSDTDGTLLTWSVPIPTLEAIS